jgi:hypothetical protein
MQYLMRQKYTNWHSPAAKIEKSHGFTIGTNFGRKWGGLLTGNGWCGVEIKCARIAGSPELSHEDHQ